MYLTSFGSDCFFAASSRSPPLRPLLPPISLPLLLLPPPPPPPPLDLLFFRPIAMPPPPPPPAAAAAAAATAAAATPPRCDRRRPRRSCGRSRCCYAPPVCCLSLSPSPSVWSTRIAAAWPSRDARLRRPARRRPPPGDRELFEPSRSQRRRSLRRPVVRVVFFVSLFFCVEVKRRFGAAFCWDRNAYFFGEGVGGGGPCKRVLEDVFFTAVLACLIYGGPNKRTKQKNARGVARDIGAINSSH